MFRRECVVGTSAVALVAATLAISCSSSPTTSISPSATSAAGGGATITGTVESSTTFRSLQALPFRAITATSPTVTVSIVGTNIAATVAPGESFTLNGVPTGNVTLQISGAVTAQITIPAVQNQEQIRVSVRVDDSGASITVKERTAPTTNGDQARLQGPITSIDQPNLTFVVNGVTVSVPAGVPIMANDHSLAFTDLKMGDRVTVSGNLSGAMLVATKVQVEDGQEADQGNNNNNGNHGNGHGGDRDELISPAHH